ncbi:MAG: YceI family protein [Dehalococcoidia bacterium]
MTWELDAHHLELGFAVKHMMVATVRGRFTEVEAEVSLDEERPDASRVTATVQAASLTTGNPDRDAHLRSADFFDVERYPTIMFRSTSVGRTKEGRFDLDGELTIRGVTQDVSLSGEFTGPVASPMGGRVVGFSIEGEIDREAFGLGWNAALETGGVLVGRTVRLQVDAEVHQAASVAA